MLRAFFLLFGIGIASQAILFVIGGPRAELALVVCTFAAPTVFAAGRAGWEIRIDQSARDSFLVRLRLVLAATAGLALAFALGFACWVRWGVGLISGLDAFLSSPGFWSDAAALYGYVVAVSAIVVALLVVPPRRSASSTAG